MNLEIICAINTNDFNIRTVHCDTHMKSFIPMMIKQMILVSKMALDRIEQLIVIVIIDAAFNFLIVHAK